MHIAIAFLVALLALSPSIAWAQLRSQVVASGLTHPLEFVQDPSNPSVQYIVEQEGRIRVLSGGVLQGADFLNLSGAILTGGEQGLLGLAFPPNFGSSGRFYVFFTNPAGDLVVSRFRRSAGNPLVADGASRGDLRWSTGELFIRHPGETNHNGGHLAFGPDGYLYVSVGDGGGGGDLPNNAQNVNNLLGKLLRIDVSVDNGDAGIPATNPFVGRPNHRPEIWDVGLRNPWKFTFDRTTGAILIADVGQGAREEINYEPPGSGGRNYGWSLREGTLDFDPGKPPAFLPLDEPIFDYDRGAGRSISGGFVYRGTALGPSFGGRYFFADYVTARVWSIALVPGPGGVVATDLRDHTADLNPVGNVSAFGQDASGELYVVSHSRGEIRRISGAAPIVTIDSVVAQPGSVEIAGWAIDRRAPTGSGIDTVHVYAFAGLSNPVPPAPVFLGAFNAPFQSRPDVGAVYGAQFTLSGFRITSTQFFIPGPVLIAVYARSVLTGQFEVVATRLATLSTTQVAFFQDQTPTGTVRLPATYSGWAIDRSVATAPPQYGTGIGQVLVDVLSTTTGQLVQVNPATYGTSRPDVAAIFGARFQNSGFSVSIRDVVPGTYQLRIRYRLTSNGAELSFTGSTFTVGGGPILAIGVPATGSTVPSTFLIGGWALDQDPSAPGTGVDAVHVWAYRNPGSGTPPVFWGAAQMGVPRPDVGALFGSRFNNAGFNVFVGPVAAGTYDVVVFARSSLTLAFETLRVIRVTVTVP